MTTIVFIADVFKEDLIGGAELNDYVLINELKKRGINFIKKRSSEVNEEIIIQNEMFIISNFTALSDRIKNILMLKKYIIYEHDHKYIKSRNPSIYPNFIIPKSEIINHEFYRKAHSVVVLSDICKQILEKALNIDNVVSIGCSLWAKDKLNFIKNINIEEKKEKYCILNSNNPIKGTRQAIEYCEKNNLKYDLVGPLPENNLLIEIAKYKYFIFMPQVLETLSRIVVEAKMLNCKVLTNKRLIGASYEEWFSLNSKELIEKIEEKIEKAIDTFYNLVHNNDITVILNCYRRPEYLLQQIESIKKQTVPPKQIWLWINQHEDNENFDFSCVDVDRIIRNDFNWKFYGRFAAALLADTKYIALFDDDTIPGNRWLENCLNTMSIKEGILGGAGVILNNNRYYGHDRHGWSSSNQETIEVDLVGHAWFFKTDWLKYLWMEKPFTWENGEDIQFSYCSQKYGNIKTYCPPHPKNKPEMFSSLKGYELGVDEKATSRVRNHNVFYAQRDACVKNAILKGWKPIYTRENSE
jgi:hypothetical protein